MTWRYIFYFLFLNYVLAEEKETRTVFLNEGAVTGTKYWDGDFYEFFGVPYAEAPTGRDRYQAPLPVKRRDYVLSADVKNIVCYQSYFTEKENEDDEFIVSGEDDCLIMNLYVPELASKENLVPVVVYIHSGAYAGGSGNMARFHYLARHDILVISFNYRLGAIGFACLGNREIPGNAGLKDQLAALRWIKKNIKQFGGDPNRVTLAGYSVGASMAELLALSKTTDGLIDQLILDSASALSPFAINRDPIGTAKNLALRMGYNGTESLEELTEFYLNVSVEALAETSLNFFLPNSTFGFSPCIENVHKGIEPVLTESPLDILRRGQKSNIPVLIGFSNMEGISRTIKFGEWREKMTEDFSNFLPADLIFDNDQTKQTVIKEIKQHYFKGDEVNHEKLQNYIDYFSDSMFKYSIAKSLKLRAAVSKKRMYFYEFNYVGKLNMQHYYMDRIKGASHRDQTAYILDFFGWTNSYRDLDMRDRMSIMWADFVTYGDPTAYESAVINYKWLPYTNEEQNYLYITKKPTMKKNLFADGYNFWNQFYEKYYWNPTAPKQPKVENIKKKYPQPQHASKELNKEEGRDSIVNDIKDKDLKNVKIKDSEVAEETKIEDKKVDEQKVKQESKIDDNKMKQNNIVEKKFTEDETNELKKDQKNAKEKEEHTEKKSKQPDAKENKSVKKNEKESNDGQDKIKIETVNKDSKTNKETTQEPRVKKG